MLFKIENYKKEYSNYTHPISFFNCLIILIAVIRDSKVKGI